LYTEDGFNSSFYQKKNFIFLAHKNSKKRAKSALLGILVEGNIDCLDQVSIVSTFCKTFYLKISLFGCHSSHRFPGAVRHHFDKQGLPTECCPPRLAACALLAVGLVNANSLR
jgi:hypothetical protein